MRVDEIAPGLWRWTGRHPAWSSADVWPEEVGCVYFEAADAVALIDPLIPPEDREEFLAALDRDVERAAKPVVVLLTTESHARSGDELVERYAAEAAATPEGVEPVDTGWYGERAYLLTAPRALVAGDALLGDGRGGVRLADEWLGDDRDRVRAALLSMLDRRIDHVLLAHGEPVLGHGRDALARALNA